MIDKDIEQRMRKAFERYKKLPLHWVGGIPYFDDYSCLPVEGWLSFRGGFVAGREDMRREMEAKKGGE